MTRTNHIAWLDKIRERFGDAPLGALNDRRMRGDILEWRDQWIDKPRTADAAIATFRRLLAWASTAGD